MTNGCTCSSDKNSCQLQKHFDFMWHSGFAHHSQCTYNSLRGLLSDAVAAEETELDLKPGPEQAYMLGATALDCSIMLTFQEIEIEWKTDCPAGGRQRWVSSVEIHDLMGRWC